MNDRDWQVSVPEFIKADSLWRMAAYRLGLFLSDVAWVAITRLSQDGRTVGLSDQLYRAVGSISANLAEGCSRGTGRDRARFYEYALGSAREARGWYFKGRHLLGPVVSDHRFGLLAEILRLLLTMVPDQRGGVLKEDPAPYRLPDEPPPEEAETAALEALLGIVPLPEVSDDHLRLPA